MAVETAWGLKLARAREHCDALELAIRDYLDTRPYELVPVELPSSRGLRLTVAAPPPSAFALVVGDALHNLRSALDTRLVGVAEQLAGRLTEDQERVLDIPLVDTEGEFRDQTRPWRKRLPDLADDLERIVSRLSRGLSSR